MFEKSTFVASDFEALLYKEKSLFGTEGFRNTAASDASNLRVSLVALSLLLAISPTHARFEALLPSMSAWRFLFLSPTSLGNENKSSCSSSSVKS